MFFLVYFFIALLATVLGSLAGLGGGVIIKPMLDFYGRDGLNVVGALSSITVFSMACMALFYRIKDGVSLKVGRISVLSIGSIIGGLLGGLVFDLVMIKIGEHSLQMVQSIILSLFMVIIYLYTLYKDRFPDYDVKNYIVLGALGILLGFIASFLGIGGGPINVMILMLVMALNAKEAAIHSIFIIFFAQLSKIVFIGFTGLLFELDILIVLVMIVGGLSGGFVGSKLSKRVTSDTVIRVFQMTVLLLIILNLYNFIRIII